MNRELLKHYEEVYNSLGENVVLHLTAEQAQAEKEEIESKVEAAGYTFRWDREAHMFHIVPARGIRAFIKRVINVL